MSPRPQDVLNIGGQVSHRAFLKHHAETQNSYGPSHPPMVYAIRSGPFVKIGWTASMGQRVRTIRDAMPYPVEVVGVTPGGRPHEGWLHKKFAAARTHREWFTIDDAITEWFKTLQPYTGPER